MPVQLKKLALRVGVSYEEFMAEMHRLDPFSRAFLHVGPLQQAQHKADFIAANKLLSAGRETATCRHVA